MIFGLFNTGGQRLVKDTEELLAKVSMFPKILKEKIGEDIVLWILRCADKEIDSVKAIGKDAMEERQYQMTGMGEENPDWIRACIVENYVAAKTYHFGKAKSEEVITMIVHWIQDNAPKTYKKSKKRLSNV
jgi:hypothetical protein